MLTVKGYKYDNFNGDNSGLVTLGNRDTNDPLNGRLIGPVYLRFADVRSTQHIASLQSGLAKSGSTLLQVGHLVFSQTIAGGSILFMRGTEDPQQSEYSVNVDLLDNSPSGAPSISIENSSAMSAVDASTGVSMTFSGAIFTNNEFAKGAFIFGSENAGQLVNNDQNRLIFDTITVTGTTVITVPHFGDFTGISLQNATLAAKSSDTVNLEVTGVKFEDGHENKVVGIKLNDISFENNTKLNLTVNGINNDKNAITSDIIGAKVHDVENTSFDQVSISNLYSTGGNATGFITNGGDFGTIYINNIQAKNRAEGLQVAGNGQTLQAKELTITGVSGDKYTTALTVDGSTLDANKTTINVTGSDEYAGYFKEKPSSSGIAVNQFAIRATSDAHINFHDGEHQIAGSVLADDGANIALGSDFNTKVLGDVFAVNGGKILIDLNTEDSILDGQIDDHSVLNMNRSTTFVGIDGSSMAVNTSGSAELSLRSGSTWIARGRNVMTSLNFGQNGGGTVDLSQTPNGSLTVANLQGNGSFKMGFSPYDKGTDTVANGNMLYVTQTFDKNSTHNIEIIAHNDLSSIDQLDGMRFATTVGDAGDAKSFKVTMKDQGFFNRDFAVKTEKYDSNDENNVVFNGEGKGYLSYKPGKETVNEMFDGKEATNWYIDLGGDETPDPDEPNKPGDPDMPGTDLSDAGQALMATLRGTYWNAISMDRLNQRLGDARYAHGTDGLWVRVKHDQFGTDTGVGDFKSKGQTYKLGYDHAFVKDGGRLLTGIAVDYMTADIDYRGVQGQGTMDRIAGTAYATWLADDGFYFDATAKYGVLSNSFDIYTASGTVVNSDHENHVLGASLEVGKKLTNPNGMFLEPQLQMQYSHVTSSNFGTSQATSIYQGSIDSIVTRMGIRLGCMLGEDQRSNVYWKADVLKEWAGKQTVKVHDVTTTANGVKFNVENDHAWFDIGAGFQYNLTKDIHAYADVEYRFGNEVDKSWTVNGGARWQF